MTYGGRTAEELVFGYDRVTTGASSDIQQATSIARRYVTQWGLSDAIGPILVGDNEQELFLGREIQHRREVSEQTAQLVDAEVKRVITNAYDRAKAVLSENLELLHTIAAALLERETLTARGHRDDRARREAAAAHERRAAGDAASAAGDPDSGARAAAQSAAARRTGALAGLTAVGRSVSAVRVDGKCSWRSTASMLRPRPSYVRLPPTDSPLHYLLRHDHLPGSVRGRTLSLERPLVMGILNVTPDSFSDGGQLPSVADAVARAEALLAEGADILDVGGESTRPQRECRRQRTRSCAAWCRVDRASWRASFRTRMLSIDTVKSGVAAAAIDAGAHIVNDVSGAPARSGDGATCARTRAAGVVLMHSRGGVQRHGDLRACASTTATRWTRCSTSCASASTTRRSRGSRARSIAVDPGIGFAKRSEHSLRVLASLDRLAAWGYPVHGRRVAQAVRRRAERRARAGGSACTAASARPSRRSSAARASSACTTSPPTRQALDVAAADPRARAVAMNALAQLQLLQPGMARPRRDLDRRVRAVPRAAAVPRHARAADRDRHGRAAGDLRGGVAAQARDDHLPARLRVPVRRDRAARRVRARAARRARAPRPGAVRAACSGRWSSARWPRRSAKRSSG